MGNLLLCQARDLHSPLESRPGLFPACAQSTMRPRLKKERKKLLFQRRDALLYGISEVISTAFPEEMRKTAGLSAARGA